MMRSLKRVRGTAVWVIVALLLIASMLPVAAFAAIDVVQPTEQFYVLDKSNVLEQKTENEIVDRSAALYKECGAQIVVVAVDFIGSYDLNTYAMQLFNQWGIGGDKNNGVLLLMVIGADDYWCTQGKGLESTLSSGDIKSILDTYLEPDFAVKDYNTGVQKFYSAMYDKVASIYGATGVDWSSMDGWGGNTVPGSSNISDDNYDNYDNGYNGGYRYEDDSRSSGSFFGGLFGAVGGIIKTVAIIILVVVLVLVFGIFGGRGGRGSSYRRPPRPPMFGPTIFVNPRRHDRDDHNRRGGGGGWGGFGGWGGGSGGGSSGGGFGGFGGGGGGWGGGGGGSHSGGGGSTRGGGAGRG